MNDMKLDLKKEIDLQVFFSPQRREDAKKHFYQFSTLCALAP